MDPSTLSCNQYSTWVKDIHNLPTPQDKDLQKILGIITYVSACMYVPKLSDRAVTLRDPNQKNVPFIWQEDHQAAFESIILWIRITHNPWSGCIAERSWACLLQKHKRMAFASKSLSSVQRFYSNIERETLALVFGITRFHNYIFGKEVVVNTDHKPLEIRSEAKERRWRSEENLQRREEMSGREEQKRLNRNWRRKER